MKQSNLNELENFFGLDFNDKDLLITALTHSSYSNENNTESYERLEFLGDAVLDLAMGKYLYDLNKDYDEGILTKKRAQNVCESALVDYAKLCHLDKYILLGKGEEKSGGRNRIAILADTFESLLGAIYLDKGLDEVYKVLNKVVFPMVDSGHIEDFVDYKSNLQELVQSDKRSLSYKIVGESGPSHNKVFISRVLMDEIIMGEGTGKSKKEAEQNAAKEALDKLVKKVNK